ncbi:hypothetical protein FB451DRAFT_1552551 [Mycena latifolia]|nr:hypothetical protein FB451DRAFT_1552551 [Mycena latifolia]
MQLWIATLLGSVSASLMNHTLDDRSPSIIYGPGTIECPSTACPGIDTARLFNGTSTITTSSITIPFTGSAIYLFFTIIGSCNLILDGNIVEMLNFTLPAADTVIGLPPSCTMISMPDGPHTLVIAPSSNATTITTLIELDYIIYTASTPRKSHVAAIVGGVIGGVVLTGGMFGALLFLRRRDRRKRLFRRGIPLGDQDEPSVELGRVKGKV